MSLDEMRSGAHADPAGRDRSIVSAPHLRRLQVRHFVLFDVMPALGTALAMCLLALHPIGWPEIDLFLGLWLASGIGLTVGFHRLLSHGAFGTPDWIKIALVIMGCMAARGPAMSWAAMHRRHHERADHEGDLHSPNLHGRGLAGTIRGLMHAQLTWMIRHDYPNVAHYVPDLLRDRAIVWANRRYHLWVALGLVLPAAMDGLIRGSLWGVAMGLLWGGFVRIFVVEHTMSIINSLLHRFGSRPFRIRIDNSRNLWLLSLVTWGEAWHNNHHAFPYSAAFGLKWYEFDPGFWLVRGLQVLGLAWNVKRPLAGQIGRETGLARCPVTLFDPGLRFDQAAFSAHFRLSLRSTSGSTR